MQKVHTTLFRAEGFHTFDSAIVREILVAGGRILATGNRGSFDPRDADEIVELPGWVTPGFNDAHIHPAMMSQNALYVDLSPERVSTEKELLSALQERAAGLPPGSWVIGSRYDETKSTAGRILTREVLDRALPNHPVLILHVAVHWGVANTAALALAVIDENTPPPEGGSYGRDDEGRLTGVLFEQALFNVAYSSLANDQPLITPDPLELRLRAFEAIQQSFHAAGLTSVCDALSGPDEVSLLSAAHSRGRLTLRTSFLVPQNHLSTIQKLGLQGGIGDDMFRFVGIKAFVDGACAGGNCLLDEPFEGTDYHGMQVVEFEHLVRLVRQANERALPLGIHANGDRAIRLVLDAHEQGGTDASRGIRHRIEHCTLIDDEILERIKHLGLTVVPFGPYARFHGDKLEKYYGRDRLERMFAHRSFLEHGIPVAGSSDFPCGPFEPLEAIASCVQRRSIDGKPVGLSQRISIEQAWRIYTSGSAFATGEERYKGTLAPGMLADFITFDVDPLSVDDSEIQDLEVTSTWVGGSRVWSRA